jgi:hypothetical protein
MTDAKQKRKHEDTRISAYPHPLEEVLEKALQVRPEKESERTDRRQCEDGHSHSVSGT